MLVTLSTLDWIALILGYTVLTVAGFVVGIYILTAVGKQLYGDLNKLVENENNKVVK